jgi:restriction system protein
MALLTSKSPTDWKDLQTQVATILDECGFDVDTERTFETVRGSVELDVYAEEKVNGRKYSIVCECKHWRSRVPQAIIHAFRTVVSDLGVNLGYVISCGGFQAGAFSASELTNTKLFTWEEFQVEFLDTWLKKHFSPTITRELDAIIDCTAPLVPDWFIKVPKHEVAVLRSLREKHQPFGLMMLGFTAYSRMFWKDEFPDLPLRDRLTEQFSKSINIPDSILDAMGYRDLLEVVLEHGKRATSEFDVVKQRNNL